MSDNLFINYKFLVGAINYLMFWIRISKVWVGIFYKSSKFSKYFFLNNRAASEANYIKYL